MRIARWLPILLLAGCAASAQTGPRVDVAALVRDHPLYGTLAQYDRQIAALNATLHTQFANATAQATNARAAVSRDLTRASSVTQRVASAGFPAAQPPVAANGYLSVLQSQSQSDYANFISAINARTQRAYTNRAQTLRESESNLELDIARKDAPQRLQLRAQLQTLDLTPQQRAFLTSQLATLQRRETAQLDALRSADAQILESYRKQVNAQAQSGAAAMQAKIRASVDANVAAHRNVAAMNTPAMRAQYQKLMRAPLPGAQAYATAQRDLTADFSGIATANADAVASTRAEIAALQRDRSALRATIVSQIEAEANAIAHSRGYSGAKLNAAVAAALKSLSP
jgi:hypothetical protein